MQFFKLSTLASLTLSVWGFSAAAGMDPTLSDNPLEDPRIQPVQIEGLLAQKRIADEYIVTFKDQTSNSQIQTLAKGLNQQHRGSKAIASQIGRSKLLRAKLDQKQLMQLAYNPNVAAIEVNQVVSIADMGATSYKSATSSWGLDRLDQETLPLDNQYTPVIQGWDSHVYILDTGIYTNHAEFAGRAVWDFTASGVTGGNDDHHGHGTHLAGVVGSQSYGVAPAAMLHSVKVFDNNGTGTVADVLEGMNYVIGHNQWPTVMLVGASMPSSAALDSAVHNMSMLDISVALPAGDYGQDVCHYSPQHDTALTVAASTANDDASVYSNKGDCVDIYAPGLYVKSTWHTSPTANNSISHSPISAAFVAGAMAAVRGGAAFCNPSEVNDKIINQARDGVLNGVPANTANKLLAVPTGNFGYGWCDLPKVSKRNYIHNELDFVHYAMAEPLSAFLPSFPDGQWVDSGYGDGVTLSGRVKYDSTTSELESDGSGLVFTFDQPVHSLGFAAQLTDNWIDMSIRDVDGNIYDIMDNESGFIGLTSDILIDRVVVWIPAGSTLSTFYDAFQLLD